MIYVISHILENVLVNSSGEHMKQVNAIIKTLFHGISDNEINDTFDTFLIEYDTINYKNGTFYGDYFICSIKDILENNSHIRHQKYSLTFTNVLGFLSCRAKSKIIGIVVAGRFWVDFKTIKYGKRSDIINVVSYKQSIVYTYTCIKSGRIARSESGFNIDVNYPRHVWDDDDEVFIVSWENGMLTRL